VFEYEQQAVEEVTGSGHAKTGRQRSALDHLARWARAYTEQKSGSPLAEPEARSDRRLQILSLLLAAVIVALVLLLLYGSVS
jgi:hypothetical protein